MKNDPDLKPILNFLDELTKNNNKAWFDQHRPSYESARGTFEQFIEGIIDEFRESDHLRDLSAKNCIARIYRDIRFSKDKSPYKINFGALIAPGGWKNSADGYYISIQPHGQSMVAGGLYAPTPKQLERFRQRIDREATAFKKITRAKAFAEIFGKLEGERLKTAPKGYDRDHPEIELLQLKQITVIRRFSDKEVLRQDFAEQVISTCHAMRPFLNYVKEIQ
jgi:uncharacterized protein (TIGR02453 family)